MVCWYESQGDINDNGQLTAYRSERSMSPCILLRHYRSGGRAWVEQGVLLARPSSWEEAQDPRSIHGELAHDNGEMIRSRPVSGSKPASLYLRRNSQVYYRRLEKCWVRQGFGSRKGINKLRRLPPLGIPPYTLPRYHIPAV